MKTQLVIGLLLLTASLLYVAHKNQEPASFGEQLVQIVKDVNSKNGTWKAEVNPKWLTMTKEEIIGRGGVDLSKIQTPEFKNSENSLTQDATEVEELPRSFDSRLTWPDCPSIKEISDQSSCGSCWAFASATVMSDRICIHSEGKSQPRLSAEDLLECCHTCGSGCRGGGMVEPYQYWISEGISTGSFHGDKNTCKPYFLEPCVFEDHHPKYPRCPELVETPTCVKKCQPSYKTDYASDKFYGKSYNIVNGEEAIMREIVQNGPVSGVIEVYGDFMGYRSGIYQHTTDTILAMHAVRILGFGEEKGVKFWIAASHSNETWGEDGFFRIMRGTNECKIEEFAIAGLPKF